MGREDAPLEAPPRTGLEDLPPGPHRSVELQAKEWVAAPDFSSQDWPSPAGKKKKFVFVLFYDTSERSARIVQIIELAARELQKERLKDVRKVQMARFNTSGGDTRGFRFQSFPKMMFFRKGYKNPKAYDGFSD